jgi:hypothetical protein
MLPSLLSVLIIIPLPESPKHLLLHENDRDGAIKALTYYQGNRVSAEILLNDILKESTNTRVDLKMRQAFVEIFRISSLRKATVIGILALQVSSSLVINKRGAHLRNIWNFLLTF